MALTQRFPIKLAVDSFRKYRAKQLDIAGLEQSLSKAISLLEGDIPKDVQDAIRWADAEIDTVQFTLSGNRAREAVEKVWRELDEVIARNSGPEDTAESEEL